MATANSNTVNTLEPDNRELGFTQVALEADIKRNIDELILAQDGLRGLSYCLNVAINDDHVERMEFVIGTMANLIQRVTNELDNNVFHLINLLKESTT